MSLVFLSIACILKAEFIESHIDTLDSCSNPSYQHARALPVAKMLTLRSRTSAMRPVPKPSAHSIRLLTLRSGPRVSTRAAAPDGVGMSPELRAKIDKLIASNNVVVRKICVWLVNAVCSVDSDS